MKSSNSKYFHFLKFDTRGWHTWFFEMLLGPYFLYLPNLFPFILFYFWQIIYEAFATDAHITNYFCQASSVTCPWDMPCSKTCRSINPHFSRTMQIMTNSIILHYVLHANLTNSEESEGLAVLLKGMLADWRIENNICHPLLPIQLWPPRPTAARQLLLLCDFQTRIIFTPTELSARKLHTTNQGNFQVQKINGNVVVKWNKDVLFLLTIGYPYSFSVI